MNTTNDFLDSFIEFLNKVVNEDFPNSDIKSEDESSSTEIKDATDEKKENLGKSFYERNCPSARNYAKETAERKRRLDQEIIEAVYQYIKSGLQNDAYKMTWHKWANRDILSYGIDYDGDVMLPEWCSFEAYFIDSIPSLILADDARQEFLNKFDSDLYEDTWYDAPFMNMLDEKLTEKLSKDGIAKVWISFDSEDYLHPKFTVCLAFKK